MRLHAPLPDRSPLTYGAARAGGALLAGAAGVLGRLRRPAKPLHPRGEVWSACLTRHGRSEPPTGVPWLDDPGTDTAVVRLSAALGLPRPWPDVRGLALRVLDGPAAADGLPADLLLATTGSGRISRFLLAPASRTTGHTFTTLLPYRGPQGAVEVSAQASGERRFGLCHATLAGPWQPFATLDLKERLSEEPTFDPLRHLVPGLSQFGWVRLLRDPAYRAARRIRSSRPV
ncbi:hypothetical protein [Nocardioides daejeonensis]|uniref:hypothetical protein n=1 Tax=Nocardioides daejeonensis TaxID=1046556 RepID=UPI0013A583E9|nr:hypothetical protein [Nocardioides daejeonensis]